MFEPLTQPEPSERGCHWQLHLWSDNGGTYRVKAGLFRRPSILFRPLTPAMPGGMVEPPGTAPGSEPFITGAFITIVRVAPDRTNIGGPTGGCKRRRGARPRSVSGFAGKPAQPWFPKHAAFRAGKRPARGCSGSGPTDAAADGRPLLCAVGAR